MVMYLRLEEFSVGTYINCSKFSLLTYDQNLRRCAGCRLPPPVALKLKYLLNINNICTVDSKISHPEKTAKGDVP